MARGARSADAAKTEAWDAILGFGSNIGDKVANIDAAIEALCRGGDIRVVERSKYYRTAPWGILDQDWFVNAAASVVTELSPAELLERCLRTEVELGRVRTTRWGPRKIDIDILIYRDQKIDTTELTVPHPRLHERGFVLVPLAELAPDFKIHGRPIKDWLASIDHSDVVLASEERT
jgi:2-amino-4-hydroxy-6-hydroxymethyldihydropteridine diphosphokinase